MSFASITSAMQSAISGLQYTQTALRVISNNITNANTEGYTRKIAVAESRNIPGEPVGVGVDLAAISRRVDEFLVRDFRIQQSGAGAAAVKDQYFQLAQDMFGAPGSSTAFVNTLNDLSTAFEALGVKPEGVSERISVVNRAADLAQQLNDIARQIQVLRKQADDEVSRAVETINEQLAIIADTNAKIVKETALGRPTGDLEDQRDQAILKVAEYIDVRTFTRDYGEVVLLTNGGKLLADTDAHLLTHTPANSLTTDVEYTDGTTGIDGIDLDGRDITSEIRSGRLAGLIAMRDEELPNLAAEIDRFAEALRDTINQVHNDGAPVPPLNALSGTRSLPGGAAAAFAGTGTARIAVVNADGTYAAAYDLNLAGLGASATVADVVTAINTGLAGFATAAVTAGRLTITATDASQGIAIDEGTSQVGYGQSDNLAASGALGISGTFEVRNGSGLLGTVTVATTDTASTVAAAIQALAGARASTLALSNGDVRIDVTSDDGSALSFTDTAGNAAASLGLRDQSRAFSYYFGLNDFFVSSNASSTAAGISVRDDIAADPQLVATAALDTTTLGSIVAGTTVALASGDNTVANRLAAAFDSNASFRAAGGIASVTTTLASYGGTVIARNSTLAAGAAERNTYLESVRSNLETRVGQVSGVNVDEELANTLLYENAYRASAQMLSTLKAILDELANIL